MAPMQQISKQQISKQQISWRGTIFRVGDRVHIKSKTSEHSLKPLEESVIYEHGLKFGIGWIIERIENFKITVNTIDLAYSGGDFFHPRDLELVEMVPPWTWMPWMEKQKAKLTLNKPNKPTTMQKLTSMLKRLLDKDAQTLYKAGYIDGDLKITDLGLEALNTIMFDAHKAELVIAAQEEIDEQEKRK
jgi:hypothetical protein